MIPPKIKIVFALVFAVVLMTGAVPLPMLVAVPDRPPLRPEDVAKPPRRCIILWMNGGPSQVDTFDPKRGNVALFKTIDTNIKGLHLSETLPMLAKQANHLAIIRSLSHRVAYHTHGSHIMRTGFEPGPINYPWLGCVLAKELGTIRRIRPVLSASIRFAHPGTP
jgi:Protein of unknown function (DUF1501)